MTGVSLGQWRVSIGHSYRERNFKNIVMDMKYYNRLLNVDHHRMALLIFGMPSAILFSKLLLFSYCTMVVTCFPIFTTIYLDMPGYLPGYF